MTHPTKEEVEETLEFVGKHNYSLNPVAASLAKRLVSMCDAYLALRDEVEEQKRKRLLEIVKYSDVVKELNAENQVLREQISYNKKPAFRVDGEEW